MDNLCFQTRRTVSALEIKGLSGWGVRFLGGSSGIILPLFSGVSVAVEKDRVGFCIPIKGVNGRFLEVCPELRVRLGNGDSKSKSGQS